MAIILIMHAEAAGPVHDRDRRDPVVAAIHAAGGEIHPMPAFEPGESGARTFVVEATDASDLLGTLVDLPGVEACYIKPQDAMP